MGCCTSSHLPYIQRPVSGKASDELLEKIRFLRETPMFSRMLPDELPILAHACKRQAFSQGDVIVRAGSAGHEFFVIEEGKASMWMEDSQLEEPVHERPLTVLGSGGHTSSSERTPPRRESEKSSMSTKVARFVENISDTSSFRASSSRQKPSSPRHHHTLPTPILSGSDSSDTGVARTINSPGTPSKPSTKHVKVCSLRRMDYFGERTLLYSGSTGIWDTTVVVDSKQLLCLKLTAERFKKLGLKEKLRIPKRRVVPLLTGKESVSPQARGKNVKSSKEAELVRAALLSCEAIQAIVHHNEDLLQALVDVSWSQRYREGEVVVGPEQDSNSCLLIVGQGMLHVEQANLEKVETTHNLNMEVRPMMRQASFLAREGGASTQPGVPPVELGPGAVYGEQTLLYDALHTAEVHCEEESVVWKITSLDYARASKLAHKLKITRHAEILGRVDAFSAMLSAERLDISRGITEQVFSRGQAIYTEGTRGDIFYILIEGEATVSKGGEVICNMLGSSTDPVAFGEHALAMPAPEESTATVAIVSDCARCMVLPRGIALSRQSMLEEIAQHVRTGAFFDQRKSRQVRQESLKKVGVLGRGAFGFVELMQDQDKKVLYALKTLRKAKVARTEYMKRQVQNEKYILELTDSRFITKLFLTGKTDQDIFFLLEACLGGELYTVYMNHDLFGREGHARFYCASVACGFEHLHERCIIYRDLKPENLLLDQAGQLKITDMGLAKFVVGETSTVCGTPVYLPPEVAQQTGYTHAVDWWQLGILVWELLARKTPFMAQTRGEALYWLVEKSALRGLDDPTRAWPKGITEGAKEFLRSVLCYEPTQRHMMKPTGAEPSLMDNLWFYGFNWQALKDGTMPAPYVPAPVNLKKLANFNNQVANNDNSQYVDDGTGWDEEF